MLFTRKSPFQLNYRRTTYISIRQAVFLWAVAGRDAGKRKRVAVLGIGEGSGGYVKRQFRVGSLTLVGGDEGGFCVEV